MITVKRLPEFDAWLDGLRDRETRIRLARRLDKAQRGNLGDIRPVGDGVFEMREFFGPGWRRPLCFKIQTSRSDEDDQKNPGC